MRTFLTTLVLLTAVSPTLAQVPCATPDDLCTGNPCVVGTLAVVTPCQVDFGDRTLVIAGTVSVPDGGALEWTAAAVQMSGGIEGSGAIVGLIADTASANLNGSIDVHGTSGGGAVYVHGETGVTLNARIRANAKSGPGGFVSAWSRTGNVLVQKPVDVRGTSGGAIRLEGPVPTVLPQRNVTVSGKLDLRGTAGDGGSVQATAPYVSFFKSVDVSGKGGNGGTVHLFASEHMMIGGSTKLVATGSANGGAIELLMPPAGAATISIFGKHTARGLGQSGGSFSASGPAGAVALYGRVDLRGASAGGQVTIDANRVEVYQARVFVTGPTGGEVRIDQSGTDDVIIDGKIDARASGTIEVSAPAASMTVTGTFFAGPAGCVAFAAGGTLDTTGAGGDVAIVASCP